ncbi:hypothetical protein T4C_4442 [Trichinella pseudospiralis]|uniref:Uncharacterized protein n=1 Tax=Trichinella pseudospiralis TaxID=6337 RepID=A0A0V1GUI6_TRIPS|nr:hypothetical protein T4C_4442 [Trichinella pseudospiralis]
MAIPLDAKLASAAEISTTKWVLIDSEQNPKSNESIPALISFIFREKS